MSVRGQVLGLLRELQQEHDLAYLLISHDLRTVRQLSERVVVMYLGEIVEQGPTDEIFTRPRHPYTKALLSATLVPDPSVPPEHVPLEGEIPKPTDLPDGCFLATRCPLAIPACSDAHPVLTAISEHHAARCIRLDQT
jgi:peptide/nickel transport system ATP-binding protein/oligopeptide transport system ATP-binding protein